MRFKSTAVEIMRMDDFLDTYEWRVLHASSPERLFFGGVQSKTARPSDVRVPWSQVIGFTASI
jgi:hypothetical protein